jgi:ribonucleoside-diphosphate reductase alpha chain
MSQLEALGRLVSLALRSGIEATAIIEQIRGIRCPSPSWEKGGRIFSCSDAIARVLERRLHGAAKVKDPVNVLEKTKVAIEAETGSGESISKVSKQKKGDIVGVCPDCGSALWHIEGCMVCNSCGYSKCG